MPSPPPNAGSSNFEGSESMPVSMTVQPLAASTFTLLVPLANPQAAGQPANFAALVLRFAGGTPAGAVQFTEGSAVLGSAP